MERLIDSVLSTQRMLQGVLAGHVLELFDSRRPNVGRASDTDALTAACSGSHGWFRRNRGSANVTIMIKVNGAYTEIKRLN